MKTNEELNDELSEICSGEFVHWNNIWYDGLNKICLDGDFTADELINIANYMKKYMDEN